MHVEGDQVRAVSTNELQSLIIDLNEGGNKENKYERLYQSVNHTVSLSRSMDLTLRKLATLYLTDVAMFLFQTGGTWEQIYGAT